MRVPVFAARCVTADVGETVVNEARDGVVDHSVVALPTLVARRDQPKVS